MKKKRIIAIIVSLLFLISVTLGQEPMHDAEAAKPLSEIEQATKLYSQPVAGEEGVIKALDYNFGWDFAKDISKFGSAIDGRGFRLAGTEAGKQASEFVYKTFQNIGLKPEYHTFPVTGWTFKDSQITIQGHENIKLKVTSAPYTPATKKEGLTSEVVFVNYGTKEDLKGVDLKGKIALLKSDMDYFPWHNNAAFQAQLHGAVGVIYYASNYYGVEKSGEAEFVGDWSGTESNIPVWSMPLNDGEELSKLAKKEKVKVNLTSTSELNRNATGYNVMAKMTGTKYPNEYIVINAHTDAYFTCFQDDSLPLGMMMAMAKAMVKSNYKPDRTILFVATDGEEVGTIGTFYDWLQGSWSLVNDKVNTWDGKIVDAHTLEMIGYKDATSFGYGASDTMYMFTQALANGFNAKKQFDYSVSVDNYMTTSSDEWSFSYMGVPTTRTVREHEADEVYHSSLDNEQNGDKVRYENHQRLQTLMILRIDKTPFAPYDLSKTPKSYMDAIDMNLLKEQGLNNDLNESVNKFVNNASELTSKNLEITRLYKEAKEKQKDVSMVDALIPAYNQALRNSAKTVITGTQYVALDTPVYQVEYYQTIPAEFDEAIQYLRKGNGPGMLSHFNMDSKKLNQWTQSYTSFMEEKVWQNAYKEALDLENPSYNYSWVTNRLLKYYDYYNVLESVQNKGKSGNKDFTNEISKLKDMKADAVDRLAKAYKEDKVMWENANKQLPIEQANIILNLLK